MELDTNNPFILNDTARPLPENVIIDASSPLSVSHRINLINKTFNSYEKYRSQNMEPTWALSDKLYAGYVEPKKWPGTEKKRSDIGMQYLFDALETAVPNIHNSLYGSPDGWFQLSPEGTTTTFEARALEDHLNYRFNKIGLKLQMELLIKSLCQYGLGGLKLTYDNTESDPIKRFKSKWIDIRKLYLDPSPGSLDVEDCKSIIERDKVPLTKILQYSRMPDAGFNPIDETSLIAIAANPIKRDADLLSQIQDTFRRISDYGDPDEGAVRGETKLEVLRYYTKSRVSWLVNGRYLLYDQPNPYSFYPFVLAPCFVIFGKLYGYSFTDALRNIHRFGEGLVNSHFDLRALEVIPPRAISSTSPLGIQKKEWFPGSVQTYQNAKDMQVLTPQGRATNVFAEIEFLDRQAEKRIGPSLAGGIPRPSNANRTVGGMQIQLQGGATRNSTIINHIDELINKPLVEKTLKMLQVHTSPMDNIEVLNPQTKNVYNISALLLSKPITVCVNGLEKLITRQALASSYSPIFQALTQGPLGKYLFDQGLTVDWLELFNTLQDALGIPKIRTLIRPLTEEEKQLAAQQQAQQEQASQQAAMASNQTRLQMGQMKAQTDLQIAQLESATEQSKIEFQRWLQDEKASGEVMKMMFERFKLFLQQEEKQEKESGSKIDPSFPEDTLIRRLKVQQEGAKLKQMEADTDTKSKLANVDLLTKIKSLLTPSTPPTTPNAQ